LIHQIQETRDYEEKDEIGYCKYIYVYYKKKKKKRKRKNDSNVHFFSYDVISKKQTEYDEDKVIEMQTYI
jgi:hypothetical protein